MDLMYGLSSYYTSMRFVREIGLFRLDEIPLVIQTIHFFIDRLVLPNVG